MQGRNDCPVDYLHRQGVAAEGLVPAPVLAGATPAAIELDDVVAALAGLFTIYMLASVTRAGWTSHSGAWIAYAYPTVTLSSPVASYVGPGVRVAYRDGETKTRLWWCVWTATQHSTER